jgi:hypothetical protein
MRLLVTCAMRSSIMVCCLRNLALAGLVLVALLASSDAFSDNAITGVEDSVISTQFRVAQFCSPGSHRCVSGGCCSNGTQCCFGKCCLPGSTCTTQGACVPVGMRCPNGRFCRLGLKCSLGGGCVPLDAVDCGLGHGCRPGQRCTIAGGCAPAGTVDCGGRWCPAGAVCTSTGCANGSAPTPPPLILPPPRSNQDLPPLPVQN